ncbi:hypothetical protein EGW08_006103 [Elysia chlorotica]|uniref:Calcium signal-modulating cyclophilin ligand n=1 Tax=Elysia chlorotica TaxID=188477 RepID=A0A433TXA6_ELYCH|nr:hypothetical protein EGW08_006103 [Elysia chlorotica]
MSDLAAAQREARRRKITQNAQARMNKLLGLPGETDTENEAIIRSPSLEVAPDSSSARNDAGPARPPSPAQASPSPYNLRRRTQRSEFSVSPDQNTAPVAPKEMPTELLTSVEEDWSQVSEEDSQVSVSRFPPERPSTSDNIDTEVPENLDATPQTEDSPSTEIQQPLNAFDVKALELLRVVVCVTTSLFCRLVLRLGIGLFLVESIFLPFFAMELIYSYIIEAYFKDVIPAQTQGTLVSAALMLCGIKPELMGVYHKIMSHVGIVMSDFSLYFFSFVVWNALIS